MRRSLLTVCAALVLVVGTARPADARMEELIDWLMELSGPGPFRGLRVEWEYMCFGTLRPGYSSGIFEGSDAKKETIHPASKCYSLKKNEQADALRGDRQRAHQGRQPLRHRRAASPHSTLK